MVYCVLDDVSDLALYPNRVVLHEYRVPYLSLSGTDFSGFFTCTFRVFRIRIGKVSKFLPDFPLESVRVGIYHLYRESPKHVLSEIRFVVSRLFENELVEFFSIRYRHFQDSVTVAVESLRFESYVFELSFELNVPLYRLKKFVERFLTFLVRFGQSVRSFCDSFIRALDGDFIFEIIGFLFHDRIYRFSE